MILKIRKIVVAESAEAAAAYGRKKPFYFFDIAHFNALVKLHFTLVGQVSYHIFTVFKGRSCKVFVYVHYAYPAYQIFIHYTIILFSAQVLKDKIFTVTTKI